MGENAIMNNYYRCDSCGCYLDPDEWIYCEKCKASMGQRTMRAKRVSEAIRISDYQNEMMEEII